MTTLIMKKIYLKNTYQTWIIIFVIQYYMFIEKKNNYIKIRYDMYIFY